MFNAQLKWDKLNGNSLFPKASATYSFSIFCVTFHKLTFVKHMTSVYHMCPWTAIDERRICNPREWFVTYSTWIL